MNFSSRSLSLVLSNILLFVACIIFASGFFPYKPLLPGLAKFPQTEWGSPPAPQFDKIIFMVIDALRSDFVYSYDSGFQFTQGLIRNGSAMPFTAHATAPTVTMPRIKAITTGSIPSFLDMILNFAESDTSSSLASQDTWLTQMKVKGTGKLTMFGDDTWLKLFPDTFHRADGTTSFFVSDFTEVDNNVTRHVSDELEKSDWSVMIMHYLGMDHIGHKSGPKSVNMIPKEREMDQIVQTIYEAIESEPHLNSTLLVLCGDHGMNDGGNHGGSAPGETSPALTFISSKFQGISKGQACPTDASGDFHYYDKIEQSDIAPTLAALLGIPMPRNNLGVLIPAFLPMWSSYQDQLQNMLYNGLQMLEIVKAAFPHPWYDDQSVLLPCSEPSSSRDTLACAWKSATSLIGGAGQSKESSSAALEALTTFCYQAQELLSSTASNYNMTYLLGGCLTALSATLLALYPSISNFNKKHLWSGVIFALLLCLYAVMMFASSYVEEEQHFWYWITSGWMVVLYVSRQGQKSPRSILALLALHRLTTHWTQSGQKYSGAPSTTTFLRSHPFPLLHLLVFTTFLNLGSSISRNTLEPLGVKKSTARALGALMTTTALIFKIAFTFNDAPELMKEIGWIFPWCRYLDLVWAARFVFIGIGLCIGFVIFTRVTGRDRRGSGRRPLLATTLLPPLTLLLLTQTRLTSTPLFLLYSLQFRLLQHLSLPTPALSLTTLVLAQTSFFAAGGTNAISSIDLSNAYNGVAAYSPVPVAILLYLSNWAGPIWWSSAGLSLVLEREVDLNAALTPPDAIPSASRTADTRSTRAQPLTSRTATAPAPSSPATQSSAFTTHLSTSTLYAATSLTAVMLACTALRTHLFVWTVFSPKFLVCVAWVVLWHGVGNGVVGGLLAWAR